MTATRCTYEIKRRTFEAARFPKGSEERAKLNLSALTSEYMTGTRYLLCCYSPDGSLAWTNGFRTKADAERQRDGLWRAEEARDS